MINKIKFMIIALVLPLLVASCGDSINSADDIVFPEKDVSYRYHVQPYLNYTCTYSACHGIGGSARPAYDYITLTVNAAGWVIPGNPDGSLLIQVLENPYQQHPVTNPPTWIPILDSAQVAGVRRWVKEGALNN